jgi:ATP-binding cassette subfamily B protein
MAEEDILGKAYDARLMKRLIKYLKPYWRQVAMAILLSLAVSALEAVRPYFIKTAVDTDIAHGDAHGLLITALLFLAVILGRGTIQFFNAYLTQWIGQKTIFDLRMEVYRHLQELSLKFYDRNPIGRLITRVTNDVEVLNEMFSSGIVMVFSDVFTIIGIFYFMFTMNWMLSLVTLSVLPFLFYGTFLFRRKAREAYRDVRRQIARINTFMQEHITGMLVDQLFSRERKSFEKFSDINGAHRDANIRSIFYYALFYPAVDVIGAVAVGLIIWYAGAHAFQGAVSVGTVIAFVQFNEMFWRPIRDLSEKYNILQTAMASSERIFELLDDTTILPVRPDPVPLAQVRGDIDFKNVWFAYNPPSGETKSPEWILKNVSFSIKQGETVAIVGHTGAGKTTTSREKFLSTESTSGMSHPAISADISASCCRMFFFFPETLKATSVWGTNRFRSNASKQQRAWSAQTSSLNRFRADMTALSKNGERRSPEDRNSSFPSPGRWRITRAFLFWMKRHRASIRKPSCSFRKRYGIC